MKSSDVVQVREACEGSLAVKLTLTPGTGLPFWSVIIARTTVRPLTLMLVVVVSSSVMCCGEPLVTRTKTHKDAYTPDAPETVVAGGSPSGMERTCCRKMSVSGV